MKNAVKGEGMMKVSVRRAAVSDIDALLRYDSHIGRETLMTRIEDGFVFAVLSCERIIGILRYGLLWQTHPFLELLFLDPAHRGYGLGKICMRFWEDLMRGAGYRYALTSTQEDETAKSFYEKLGYEQCGSFFPPEQEAAELIYRKRL